MNRNSVIAIVVVAILFFLADRFFLLGVIFAVCSGIGWAAVPLGKGVKFLFAHQRLRSVRLRAVLVTGFLLALVVGLIGFVPVPYRTRTEGVVWIPEEAFVRAGSEGFVQRVVKSPGDRVAAGELLVQLQEPTLAAKTREMEARVREMEARYEEQIPLDRLKAEIIAEELRYVRESLRRIQERGKDLAVRSRTSGTFVLPAAEDLPGRFVLLVMVFIVVCLFNSVRTTAVIVLTVPLAIIGVEKAHSGEVAGIVRAGWMPPATVLPSGLISRLPV